MIRESQLLHKNQRTDPSASARDGTGPDGGPDNKKDGAEGGLI